METVELHRWSNEDYGTSSTMANLSIAGDMLHKLTLEISPFQIPSGARLVQGWPRILFEQCILHVGGVEFKTYGRLMQILMDLNHGTSNAMKDMACMHVAASNTSHVYVDLPFFFDKHATTGLPTVHTTDDLEIAFMFATIKEIFTTITGAEYDDSGHENVPSFRLLGTFVTLPKAHVASLIAQPQEYVIETHALVGEQTNVNTSMAIIDLTCRHCTKELIVAIHSNDNLSKPHTYCIEDNSPLKDRLHCERIQLYVDNKLREWYQASAMHHALVNTVKHHKNSPTSGVMCMPFCSSPDSLQPSGTLNFGRFSFKHLHVSGLRPGSYAIYVYAIQYELLHVIRGKHQLYNFSDLQDEVAEGIVE